MVNPSRHSFRPVVQAWHNEVREEERGQEKNLDQSLCQQGDDLPRDIDNQWEVGLMKL